MKYWLVDVIHDGAGVNEQRMVPASQIHTAVARAIQAFYDTKKIKEAVVARAVLYGEAANEEEFVLQNPGVELRMLK